MPPLLRQVMDRHSITRHLLSDPQDPFSRKPLTADMLEPNDALREEIEDWIRFAFIFYRMITLLRVLT